MSRIIEKTIYTIDELTPEAQAKAVQNWIDNDDLPDMPDAMNEKLAELLDDHKITYDDFSLYYNLSYSQGGGAMFTSTNLYWGAYQIEIRRSSSMYYHEKTAQFWNATSVKTGRDMPEAKLKQFIKLYEDICQKVARYGYDYIEHEHDTEHVLENLRANEYEFYANGDMYNG